MVLLFKSMTPGRFSPLRMSWFTTSRYHAIDSGENDNGEPFPLKTTRIHWSIWLSLGLMICCFAEAFALVLVVNASKKVLPSGADQVQLPLRPIEFISDARFQHLNTEEEVDAAWSIYNLPAAGFVHLSHPELFHLKPNTNVVSGVGNVYMISAFHQLHCIKELQKAFVAEQGNGTLQSPDKDLQRNHASHCFDYLRQGALCAADTALEGPDLEPSIGESPLRGWGVQHACKSWEHLLRWRDSNAL